MKAILIGLVLAACGKPQPSEAPRDVKTEAKAPTAQEAARKQAREVDLPKLRGTSRTVVTWATGKTQERIGGEITRLVDALTITDAQPSGGKVAATITFYRS